MTDYLGDFAVGQTVRCPFGTVDGSGGSITRATNGTIRIYKNTSTTERSSSNGITDLEDFDSLTGVHFITVNLADDTDPGFYAAGNDYTIILVGAVVDGQTINIPLGHFSIENRYMRGTNNALLAAGVPANFAAMLISAAGKVTVGTNDDKTGYTATSVTNPVTVGTNSDKTGYSISGTKQTLDQLNDFNPSTQAVANVTTVGTVTNPVTAGTVSDKTGYGLSSAERDALFIKLLRTALAENYPPNGGLPTLEEVALGLLQFLTQFVISGTAYTTLQTDKSTPAMVHTLNSATTPTSITRTG